MNDTSAGQPVGQSSSEAPSPSAPTENTDPPAAGREPTASGVQNANRQFYISFIILGGSYVLLIVLMLLADAAYVAEEAVSTAETWTDVLTQNSIMRSLRDRRIQYSIWLSMLSCTISAVLSVLVAIPMGYLLSRHNFRGKRLLDAVLDIPIVLPPLVIGLSLLILFQFPPFRWLVRDIVYQVPAVILAQFTVACAFAVRTMKSTFDHIDPRCEDVAVSLGCTKSQAFGWVLLPAAGRGILTAFTLAWARSLGEFGPLLIFAGATRMKTEVLSTSVFLELNVGDIEAAVSVSFIMVMAAILVLILTRTIGHDQHARG